MDMAEKGKLYIVATPIGNLKDITYRAVETLAAVDFVAAEDTRVTGKLLAHFNIKKPMVSYHKYSTQSKGEHIVSRILSGESCALVSDAGTPAVSDPGEDLVAECLAAGINVLPLPGACAAISAISVSGMQSGRFCFEGFLTVNRSSRKKRLEELASERRLMVFYEAPHKLLGTLRDIIEVFGDRKLFIAREITKFYEEYMQTTLSESIERYSGKDPLGEFVLLVEGAAADEAESGGLEEACAYAMAMSEAGAKASSAASEAAKKFGIPKSEIYDRLYRNKKAT